MIVVDSASRMSPSLRKLALTGHVASSVGWLGAVAGCAALAVIGLTSDDSQLVRSAYLAVDVIVRFIIVPLALTALVTGLVQALGTQWGLFRHYWVLIKFVITVVAAAVMLSELEMVSHLAHMAAQDDLTSGGTNAEQESLVFHTVGGSTLLLVPLALSIYKPRGRTRRARREAATQLPAGARNFVDQASSG